MTPSAAFDDYVALLRTTVKPSGNDPDYMLREKVDKAERSKEFEQLCLCLEDDLGKPGGVNIVGYWKERARNYFRQSGIYLTGCTSETFANETEFASLRTALNSANATIHYLAPLEHVEFDGEDMDFGEFRIKRFTPWEIEQLTSNRARELFYPYAALNTHTLSEYWFIHVTQVEGRDEEFTIDLSGKITLSFSDYAPPIHRACRHLALHNWGPDPWWGSPHTGHVIQAKYDDFYGPFRPAIPFVLRVTGDLTQGPSGAPNMDLLDRQPEFDNSTGEEIGDTPAPGLLLDKKATAIFTERIRRCIQMIAAIQPHKHVWEYAETALNFLLKGFLSQGFEQLLWNMVAIDAVAGQKTGSTKLIQTRIARICAENQADEGRVQNRFGELHGLRDQLVHGNPQLGKREVFEGHLAEVRDMARASAFWLLNYLDHVVRTHADRQLPSRDDLLLALDLVWMLRDREDAFGRSLPTNFPHIAAWRC